MRTLPLLRSAALASLASAAVIGAAPRVDAQAIPSLVAEVEEAADGSFLITDTGTMNSVVPGIILQVDRDGRLLHAWFADTRWTHSVDEIEPGRVLVTDTNNDRILLLESDGTVTFDSDTVSPFSDGSTLAYPNDAELLPNGNILVCDRDNHRVFEVDFFGTVHWQFGETGVAGNDALHLRGPHNMERLANGNTIIPDSRNDRILEVDAAGNVVWFYKPTGAEALNWPRDADVTPADEVLISDSSNSRIQLVDRAGNVVRSTTIFSSVYEADLLPDGTYLVGRGPEAAIHDDRGTVLWTYPPSRGVLVDEPAVTNPTTGVALHVSVHVPDDAGPANRRPAIVHVPDTTDDGGAFADESDDWARLGFVAVRFDPDGRGQSTNGGAYTTEDHAGHAQQDGLRAVLAHVAGRPDVDPDRLAIYSRGYGLTMAAGALARHPDDPPVSLLLDWEGPASREQSAVANGGHVPEPPSNGAFWSEREALPVLDAVRAAYVRLQSEIDHAVADPANEHAIDLLNAALPSGFGGVASASMARNGGELQNPANLRWSVAAPPRWIPEELDGEPFLGVLAQLVLERHFFGPRITATGPPRIGAAFPVDLDAGTSHAGRTWHLAVSFDPGPLPHPGGGWLGLGGGPAFEQTLAGGVLDAAGRASHAYAVPNDPALVGTRMFVQGGILMPGHAIPYWATRTVTHVTQ